MCRSGAEMKKSPSRYNTYVARHYTKKIEEKQWELDALSKGRLRRCNLMKARVQAEYQEQCAFIEAANQLEKERIAAEYEREQKVADADLEERLTELMDTMIQECEEQKKQIKHEFNNCEIASVSGYTYPTSKKSLRRRPNEATTYNEKRMRSKNPQQPVLLLPETEASNDLRLVVTGIQEAEQFDLNEANSRSSDGY